MSLTVDLTGRNALITGASSGLGSRFGRILAANGANVALGQKYVIGWCVPPPFDLRTACVRCGE